MRALVILFFFSQVTFGQTILSLEAISTHSLFNLYQNNYGSGGGGALSLGYRFTFKDHWSIETSGKFLLTTHGWESAELPLGLYTVRNDYAALSSDIKLIRNFGRVGVFGGVNWGMQQFNSLEKLRDTQFSIVSQEGVTSNSLFATDAFHWGLNAGVRWEANDVLSFQAGMSYYFGEKEVNFIDLGTYHKTATSIDYDIVSARPDLLIFSVGIVLKIEGAWTGIWSSSSGPCPSCPCSSTNSGTAGGNGKEIIKKGKTPVILK